MIPNKSCTKCGTEKPLDDFPRRKSSKDGYNTMCKTCVNARQGRWRELNPDKARGYKRSWMERNPEKQKEQARRYVERHPKASSERVLRWRKENSERWGFYSRTWRANKRAEAYGLEAVLTTEDVEAVFDAQDGVCDVCSEPFGDEDDSRMNLDHIKGLFEGGDNTPENVRFVHETCHDSKNGEELGRRNERRKQNDD
jgi:5-methylcytosine-specific restriction endonuclease McrA